MDKDYNDNTKQIRSLSNWDLDLTDTEKWMRQKN